MKNQGCHFFRIHPINTPHKKKTLAYPINAENEGTEAVPRSSAGTHQRRWSRCRPGMDVSGCPRMSKECPATKGKVMYKWCHTGLLLNKWPYASSRRVPSSHLFPTFPSTTPDPSSESSLESLHPWVRAHHKASGMGRASLLEVKETGRISFLWKRYCHQSHRFS